MARVVELIVTLAVVLMVKVLDGAPIPTLRSSLENVDTVFHFHKHEDLKFPLNEAITVICHIQNNADKAINVTAMYGSLNPPYAYEHYIQNFTSRPFGTKVLPDEEITLHYEFMLSKELDVAQEYAMAHSVLYEVEGKYRYANVFFNQPIELYDATSDFESGSIFELIQIIVTTVGMVALAVAACLPNNEWVVKGRQFINNTRFFKSLTSGGGYDIPSKEASPSPSPRKEESSRKDK